MRAGKVAKGLKALIAPPEDLGLLASTHARLLTGICSFISRGSEALCWLLQGTALMRAQKNTNSTRWGGPVRGAEQTEGEFIRLVKVRTGSLAMAAAEIQDSNPGS